MTGLLLIIIYFAFISLGLPDSLLGSAWPVMRLNLNMPLSSAGILSMIASGGTVISSFISGKVIRRFGTGKVTFVSVLMTAAALLGFSVSPNFYWLCVLTIPLGLGAGSVDSALNNFVAIHYKAKHMSWLHCFWGIGATAGPLILSFFLLAPGGWRQGYLVISIIQFVLVIILFCSLPLWKKFREPSASPDTPAAPAGKRLGIFSIPGVKATLLSFFCYSTIELTAGLWGSSYLVNTRGIAADVAAKWISLFYLGITTGRLVSGFALMKVSNKSLIRFGQAILFCGIIIFILPLPSFMCIPGFILLGLGCAPVFPCMLHETPARFGSGISQSMMGIQMAFSYTGSTIMPPLFGLLTAVTTTAVFPVYIIFFLIIMIICIESVNRVLKKGKRIPADAVC